MADANEIHKKWRSLIVGAEDAAWTRIMIQSSELLALIVHIDAQAAEIQSLKEAAHGLSTLAGELAADLDGEKAAAVLLTADAADAVIDGMDWDLDLTEHADMRRLVRAAEAAVLAANGKAVPR